MVRAGDGPCEVQTYATTQQVGGMAFLCAGAGSVCHPTLRALLLLSRQPARQLLQGQNSRSTFTTRHGNIVGALGDRAWPRQSGLRSESACSWVGWGK